MDRDLVRALRASGVDVVTVAEARRRSLPDEQQLQYAASQGSSLYTCNVGDFARLHSDWLGGGLHHAGIILLADQSTDVGVQIRALVRLTATLDLAAMRDRLGFLSNWARY